MAVQESTQTPERSGEFADMMRDFKTEIRELLYPLPENTVKTVARLAIVAALGVAIYETATIL